MQMADLILANDEKIAKFTKINPLQNYSTVYTVLGMLKINMLNQERDDYYYFNNVVEVSNSF